MPNKIYSLTESGFDATKVEIECHVSNGLPTIIIVGFANKAVDEAKERIRSAFSTTGINLPKKRITLNLAPADIPKDDTSFDLAMAVAIMHAAKQLTTAPKAHEAFIGELGLDGNVKPVRGIIGKLLGGRRRGIKTFWIPASNMVQAKLVPDITLLPVANLKDVELHLNNTVLLPVTETGKGVYKIPSRPAHSSDFKDIVGQTRAKRALEIAAAGSHNVLLNGPPGTGKSLLAKALPSIMPMLDTEEMLEVTHLHSLAGRDFDSIISERPFRSPHHSASNVSIVGGGQKPRPGEITLSHRGVLFFDEFPEFNRMTIEALRQPLEDRIITVARARGTVTYPANFILIATSNPCPCGYYGSSHECSCAPYDIIRYQRKISGPIIDRIDLYSDVEEVEHSRLLQTISSEESSQDIVGRVIKARKLQESRFGSPNKTNSTMTNSEIKQLAQLSPEALALLNQASQKLQLSPRSYMRTVKVARTIADLADSRSIEVPHVAEAVQYRRIAAS